MLGHIQGKTAEELEEILGSGSDTIILSAEKPET